VIKELNSCAISSTSDDDEDEEGDEEVEDASLSSSSSMEVAENGGETVEVRACAITKG